MHSAVVLVHCATVAEHLHYAVGYRNTEAPKISYFYKVMHAICYSYRICQINVMDYDVDDSNVLLSHVVSDNMLLVSVLYWVFTTVDTVGGRASGQDY